MTKSKDIAEIYSTRSYEKYIDEVFNVLSNISIYSDFSIWWKNKVYPSLLTERKDRVILIALNKMTQELMGFSIVKLDLADPKICTLYVLPKFRRKGAGKVLLRKSISLGGRYITVSSRLGVDADILEKLLISCGLELLDIVSCDGFAERVYGDWEYSSNSRKKKNKVLISIKSEYCDKIFAGEKLVEFRRHFTSTANRLIVYSSGREKKIVGSVDVISINKLDINEMWRKYCYVSGIEKDRFFEYFKGLDEGYAIELGNIVKDNISPSSCFKYFSPPQSYMYI